MNKTIQAEIDSVYNSMEALFKAKCYSFVDGILSMIIPQLWRTDLDIILAYATVTLPAKSKLPSRKRFMEVCKYLRPDVELWKGLD